MQFQENDDNLLRRFLLGELTPEEEQKVEERIFDEPVFAQQLQLNEQELVDDYVSGRLTADEQVSFENHFLTTHKQLERNSVDSRREQLMMLMQSLKKYTANTRRRSSAFWWLESLFDEWWKIPVIAMLTVGIGFAIWAIALRQSEVQQAMIALNQAYMESRPIEARITGFHYAPLNQTRSGNQQAIDDIARRRAEVLLLNLVSNKPTSEAEHALGRFYLAGKDFDQAISQFQLALKDAPTNPQLYNDLGVALLEKAKTITPGTTDGEKFAVNNQSLENFNKALELDASLNEALFNRALCYQQLNLLSKAKEDWTNYLKQDPDSPWASEAQRYLAILKDQSNKVTLNKKQIRSNFSQAYQNHDSEGAWDSLRQSRSPIGNSIVEELLDDLLKASEQENKNGTEARLQMLAFAAEVEERKVGDHYSSDLARFYKNLSSTQMTTIARARALMKSAHSKRAASITEAVKDYRQAVYLFTQAGNLAETMFANLHLGKNLIWANQLNEGEQVLQRLSELSENHQYWWLRSQSLNRLADTLTDRNEFTLALDKELESLKIAEQIDDRASQADRLITIANIREYLGEHHKSLGYLERGFTIISQNQLEALVIWRGYQEAAINLSSVGLYSAALEYQKEALRLADETKVPVIRARCFTYLGWLYGKLHKFDLGVKSIKEAIAIGESDFTSPVGKNIVAYSALRLGHLYRMMGNTESAIANYDQNIALSEQLNTLFDSHEAHEGKFMAYLAQGNNQLARTELNRALEIFENYRQKITEDGIRNCFFDVRQDVYDTAIDFAYRTLNDQQLAFEYSELSRARSLLDIMIKPTQATDRGYGPELIIERAAHPLCLTDVQSRMPADTQVIQYSLLNQRLLTWVITKESFFSIKQDVQANEIEKLVSSYLRKISITPSPDQASLLNEAKQLYDILIKPIRHLLKADRQICIIPDKILCYIPYNALIASDSGKFLLEEFTISLAPSSNVFLSCTEIAQAKERLTSESLLSVGNPHFDQSLSVKLNSLPSAEEEAKSISHFYQSAQVLIGDDATEMNVRRAMNKAQVIHLAAHGIVDDRSAMNSMFVLAKDHTSSQSSTNLQSDSLLHAYEIYGLSLPVTRLAVLSACQSGVETFLKGEGMIGMSRPFLAAGVPLVVASLWPVETQATADLMIKFHQYRKTQSKTSAQALRLAQIDLLHDTEKHYQQPFYWAAFNAIGGLTHY